MTQTKICFHCQSDFSITQSDLDFYNKISPTFAGERFQIPTPTLCHDCRKQRRLSFRNERNLYKRVCDATKQPIISVHNPESAYTIFDQKIRWSDMRDPMEYGIDFDFTKSFTEQFGDLMKKVPMCSILNINSENSDYTNICANNINCYMIIESSNNEDCYHGYWLQRSNHCIDCAMINNSELCYESVDLDNCYRLFYSIYCRDSKSSFFLENCTNCEFCFACIGLEGKKYMIFNEQKTKEEFELLVSDFYEGKESLYEDIIPRFLELKESFGKYQHIRASMNSAGDHISESENIVDSYEIHDAKNVSYSKHVWFNSGDCVDVDTVGYNSFLMYECINTALDAYNNMFCIRCWSGCNNLLYCNNCDSCSNCFGCIGLRNKSYCIFNKQYTKEEYEIMVGKIIRHMQNPPSPLGQGVAERGEFFHPSLSPFGYNETVAQEYYPVDVTMLLGHYDTKLLSSEVTKLETTNLVTSQPSNLATFGYHRSNYIAPSPQVDRVIKGQDLPENSRGFEANGEHKELGINILKVAILCEVSNKPFRIIPQELSFYIKQQLPLPRKHPDQRHLERLQLRR